MRLWRRLQNEEKGQVLYMTLVMMLLLSAFVLVLVNVIYVSVMKVRAQNAADQLALSGATLKARVLNQTTNLNGILYLLRDSGYYNEKTPFPTIGHAITVCVSSWVTYVATLIFTEACHRKINDEHWLDKVARANGLDLVNSRYAVFPVDRLHMNAGLVPNVMVIEWAAPLPPGALPVAASISPNHTWFVQSRVEMKTKSALVGGERLGIELPDIVTRARAEVVDYPIRTGGILPDECLHDWRVRLARVNEDVDNYIKRDIGSRNTGQAPPAGNAYQPGGVPAPGDLTWDSLDSVEDQITARTLEGLSPAQKYYYYRDKVDKGTATAIERCEYYELKQHLGMNLTPYEQNDYFHAKPLADIERLRNRGR